MTIVTAESGLSISNGWRGRRQILAARGRIDRDTAQDLARALAQARADAPIALDLCAAEVADEPGVVLLLSAMRRLHARQHELIVVCPQPSLRRALDRTGLARRFEVFNDRDDIPDPPPRPGVRPSEKRTVVAPRGQRASTVAHRAEILAQATLAIEKRHAEPDLALHDIAHAIATSNRQLQRVFAELASSAFRDELAAVRMHHGADLLQTTDLPVSEIAQRVGYRQSAQFAKAFRRYHHVSPSSLRRAHRKRRAAVSGNGANGDRHALAGVRLV
jgi:AraC family transcriptional regulator, regulatory protein of adaptative response / methylphosphotriester-DNA alkyltransferase methyltransferase